MLLHWWSTEGSLHGLLVAAEHLLLLLLRHFFGCHWRDGHLTNGPVADDTAATHRNNLAVHLVFGIALVILLQLDQVLDLLILELQLLIQHLVALLSVLLSLTEDGIRVVVSAHGDDSTVFGVQDGNEARVGRREDVGFVAKRDHHLLVDETVFGLGERQPGALQLLAHDVKWNLDGETKACVEVAHLN